MSGKTGGNGGSVARGSPGCRGRLSSCQRGVWPPWRSRSNCPLAVWRERPHSTVVGVHHPHVVAPQRGVAGDRPDRGAQQFAGAVQPLVVAGLAGQVGKQVVQVPEVSQLGLPSCLLCR